MKVKEYEFEANNWPPPKDQDKDGYLFGFDDEHQPYVLRFEKSRGAEGWCGVTLENSLNNSKVTAVSNYLDPREVSRKIKWWSEAPVLRSTLRRLAG